MADITWLEYLLLPLYLFFLYKLAFKFRDKYYPQGHPYRYYFTAGLNVKVAGALFIALVYGYYYGGGDSFNFFFHSRIINSTFFDHPDTWYRLITHTVDENNQSDMVNASQLYWYYDTASYSTSVLGALIGFFCFTKYLLITVIIAFLSFIGVWLLFVTFANQYPGIIKYIAIAVLFMPGPVVWGSGFFKDSFCLFAIGCLVYCFYSLFQKKQFSLGLAFLFIISLALLFFIKIYILAMLLPALALRTLLNYKKTTKGSVGNTIIFFSILILLILSAGIIIKKATQAFGEVDTDLVLKTMQMQRLYLLHQSIITNGSAYDLGDFDPSFAGIAKMAVPSINVTLFRPYIWESHSLLQMLNALESGGVLLLTLYLVFRRNVFRTIKTIYHDPNLIMCLIFSLVFAFVVGLTSANFGSLSRYKIPCTPFFMLFLMILIYDNKSRDVTSNLKKLAI